MNLNNYKFQQPMPQKYQFITVYTYSKGQVVATFKGNDKTKIEWDYLLRKIRSQNLIKEEVFDNDAYSVAVYSHRKQQQDLNRLFKSDLLREYNMPENEFTLKLIAMAWQHHDEGLQKVVDVFEDLVDLYLSAEKTFNNLKVNC